ncbi:MAG: hypothetical protein V5A55_04045 [Halovenus sp.]
MFRRVLTWFTERDADEESEDTRFVPSELDESVRYAHGGGSEAERELAAIQEEARKLEEKRRNR